MNYTIKDKEYTKNKLESWIADIDKALKSQEVCKAGRYMLLDKKARLEVKLNVLNHSHCKHEWTEHIVEEEGEEMKTTMVGKHYDIIIFDDIVSDKNVTTKEQMDKVANCYSRALSLLKPGGDVIMASNLKKEWPELNEEKNNASNEER